jgi:hypothetical protein
MPSMRRAVPHRRPSLPLAFLAIALGAGCADDPPPPPAEDAQADTTPDTVDATLVDIEADIATDIAVEDVPVDTAPPDAGPTPPPPWPVRAFIATHRSHLVGGPKAEGALGDIVIEDDTRRFVIEGIRRVGGYREYGGNVVDMGLGGGRSEDDGYGELWFGWNLLLFSPETIEIVSDGEDGTAHVRFTGRTAAYPWADSFIRPLLDPPVAPLHLTYDYTMRPGDPFLTLTITSLNDGPSSVEVQYPFVLMNQGDAVKVWTPKGEGFTGMMGQSGLRRFGAVGYERSYGIFSDVPFTGLFAYANMELSAWPIHTLAPGESRSLTMHFAPTEGGSGGMEGIAADYFDGPADGFVQGQVVGFDASTWVTVFNDDGLLGVTPVDEEGRFRMRARTGIWSAQAWGAGLRQSPVTNIRARASDPPFTTLTIPPEATITVTVSDGDGQWIPAQVALRAEGGLTGPAPAAQLVRSGRAGETLLVYATDATNPIAVQPGTWNLTFSRGYTHDMVTRRVTVEAGEALALDIALPRLVDSDGWIAGDFHLHGWWSSDSDVTYPTRVRQAAANDISLPVLTEHAYIGDLGSASSDAGLADWVAAIPAQEVTTFEYGHFNAFPLVYDPLAPSGGAVYEHGRPGSTLLDAIRAQHPGEVLIQVNHPRSVAPGFGYFFLTGLNSETRTASNRARWSENWDMIEVFNGVCEDGGANDRAKADWIALTNAGLRPILGSGSDSHDEAGGVGHPRSWVEVELTAVALDPGAIVAPLKARHSFVSCGPFVRFATSDGVGIGGRAGVDGSGEVAFAVRVEAPPWMGVSEARLLENGRVVRTLPASAGGVIDPARPGVRVDGVMRVRPGKDSWYALEVKGSGKLPFPFLSDTPYALTNAIEVDADGDGQWTPPGN